MAVASGLGSTLTIRAAPSGTTRAAFALIAAMKSGAAGASACAKKSCPLRGDISGRMTGSLPDRTARAASVSGSGSARR